MPPPSILSHPESALGISLGSDVVFSVRTEGLHLTYQWQYADGTPLSPEDARFEGRETNSLTIRNVQFSDVRAYVCVVSNGAGSRTTDEAELTIGESLGLQTHTVSESYLV